MEIIGSFIAWLGRIAFLSGLIAIPWCMGGRNLDGIFWVSALVVVSTMCALVSRIFQRSSIEIPVIVYPVIAGLIYCSLQAQPGVFPARNVSFGRAAEYWHELMKLPADEKCEVGPLTLLSPSISIAPFETLSTLSLGLIAICAGVTSCFLFSRWNERLVLFWVIGLNGCAMSLFGLYQKATWNSKIYWTYPFPGNANPFGAFINRNNAAGYMNLTLACLAGLVVYYLIKNCPLGLSLIRSPKQQDKLELKNVEVISYLISGIDLAVIASGLGLAGILAGVLVAQSRAGVLSLGMGLLVAAILLAKRLRAGGMILLGMTCILGMISSGFLWWLTPEVDVFKRIEGTNLEVISQDARWNNWADASYTFSDHWLWGTGLSSYQFAHKPYQSFYHEYWFYHAENQYLQLAIETGVVGMGCIAVLFLCWYLGLQQLTKHPEYLARESLSLLVISVIVLLSQAFQSIVDFGLYHQASLLTGMVLMCVSLAKPVVNEGVYAEINLEKSSSSLNHGTSSVLLVVLCLTSIPALLQLKDVANSERDLDQFQINLNMWELTDNRHQQRRELINKTASLESENPEYHLNRARALIEEYAVRRVEYLLNNQPITSKVSPNEMTQQSSIYLLRKVIVLAESTNNVETLEAIQADPAVRDLLMPAISHLNRAISLNPLDWRSHMWLVMLKPLEGIGVKQRIAHASETLRLNPSDPELAYLVGLAAFQDQGDQLAKQAFRLSLSLGDTNLQEILGVALSRYRFTRVLEEIVPPEPEMYLKVCQASNVPGLTVNDRRYAAIKALEILEAIPEKSRTSEQTHLLGQGYFLSGEYTSARKTLEKYLLTEPLAVNGRLLLADVYLKTKETDKAFEVIVSGLKVSNDQKLESKLRQIENIIHPDGRK